MSSMKRKPSLTEVRRNADQGEFFFATFTESSGGTTKRPIFVVGKANDSNDTDDVIVCACTTKPARSGYDLPVSGLEDPNTLVRTNKIYTVARSCLRFKIMPTTLGTTTYSSEIQAILDSVSKAVE